MLIFHLYYFTSWNFIALDIWLGPQKIKWSRDRGHAPFRGGLRYDTMRYDYINVHPEADE